MEDSVATDLSEKSNITLTAGFRWEKNASSLYRQYGQVTISHDYNERWTISSTYRQDFKKNNNQWDPVSNPRFAVTRKWNRCDFKFSDRNLIEYRSSTHHLRYRNRFQIEFPSISSLQVTPYISNEIFLEKLTDYSQNRLRVGLTTSLNPCLEFTLGYMFLLNKDLPKTWYGYNALFSDINFTF